MNFEWVTVASQATVKDGMLDLSGAGWTTYDPGGFPGVIRGAVAGYLSLTAEEVSVPCSLAIRMIGDAGNTEMFIQDTAFVLGSDQAPVGDRIHAPFVIPLIVPVARPMTVSVDLTCGREANDSAPGSAHLGFDVIEPSASGRQGAVFPGRVRSWAARCIEKALDAWRIGDHEGAALFAFVAFDSTAARAYPGVAGNGDRFKRLLRDNALVFERFGPRQLDVAGSRFPNLGGIKGKKDGSPLDVADILYHVYRCGYVHGDDSVPKFVLSDRVEFGFADPDRGREAVLNLPTRAIIGLLAVCLLEPVNSTLCVGDAGLALSWPPPEVDSAERLVLPLNEWFGRRDAFVDYQKDHGRSAVTFTTGDQFPVHIEDGGGGIRITTFFDEPAPR